MLQAAGVYCARLSRKYIPNPFIFAIILSGVVFVMGLVLTPTGPFQMVKHWYGGFWNLLAFSMQMAVILLFGYVLASSPPARKIIDSAARLPKSAGQGIILITALAVVFGYISWGLGLIVGAIAAKEVCRQAKLRGIRMHYPLAAAAGFSGLIIFNCGFSASAPLLVNTQGHFLMKEIGLIPITQTILTPYNLIVIVAYLLIIPLVYRAMHPRGNGIEEIRDDEAASLAVPVQSPPAGSVAGQHSIAKSGEFNRDLTAAVTGAGAGAASVSADWSEDTPSSKTIAERLEEAPALTWLVVIAGTSYLAYHFGTRGFDLNLNIVNFTLLVLGMVAHKTPAAYVKAIDEGVTTCGQIILQFPFYAGIMGMMGASGLVAVFANWLVAVSTPFTFPFVAFVSAAVTNMFVPSAGGQWAVQGPLLIEAAKTLNVDIGVTIMAFSYGDQLTNAIQPMWMLPLLGLTALKARDILGYTAIMMMVAFIIFGIGITLLPPLFR